MTEKCGATQELRIGSQVDQAVTCIALAGHEGPHRDVALDSDDNAITVRWHA
ncbi:hypothetical protein MHM582_2076 [Microbacterium sp. HM58-2]|nr:hypothetical protein MHM582_2076 [Microbacterium sp. HM58-2]